MDEIARTWLSSPVEAAVPGGSVKGNENAACQSCDNDLPEALEESACPKLESPQPHGDLIWS